MAQPLVTIGVPTRNRAASLRESLHNICAQDYEALDVLVSDNSSDDDTEQVCRELRRHDARVRYVRHPQNIGLHRNHNFCMDQCRGEFLCLFHDHDARAPSLVRDYVAFMQEHPSVGIVCSDWDLIDDEHRRIGTREHRVHAVTPGLEYIGRSVRSGRSSVGTPGAMVRCAALGNARFRPDAPIGFGDFPVWFRVAENWDVGHIGKRLWQWRQNSVSHSARPIVEIAREYEYNLGDYFGDHLKRWPAHAALVTKWHASMRKYLFWALVYEVALHFRKGSTRVDRGSRTLFEIMDYHLTAEQFGCAVAEIKRYRTGLIGYVVYTALLILIRLRLTSALSGVTKYHAQARTLLRLD